MSCIEEGIEALRESSGENKETFAVIYGVLGMSLVILMEHLGCYGLVY